MTRHAVTWTVHGTAAGTSITVGRTKATIQRDRLNFLAAGRLDFSATKEILNGLGFAMPSTLQAAAEPIRFGQRIDRRPKSEMIEIDDLDAALVEVGVPIDIKIKIKSALAAQGIIP